MHLKSLLASVTAAAVALTLVVVPLAGAATAAERPRATLVFAFHPN